MKKVLVTVAALGLVLGVAGNSLALDAPSRATAVEPTTAPRVPQPTAPGVALWSVSGQWVLAGAYVSPGMGQPGKASVKGRSDSNDAFYIYSFKVLPVLQVNDKIAVKAQLRFADRDVFGLTDTAEGLYGTGLAGEETGTGGRIMDVYHLYMEWMSPVGKTRFGRTPAGAWGGKFLDNSSKGDRLMLWTNFMPENWGSLWFTQKITERDAGSRNLPGPGNTLQSGDADKDGYYFDVSYKADIGKTTAALFFVREAGASFVNGNNTGSEAYTNTNLWVYGKYAFGGGFGLEYEINWGFGEASATSDQDSLGLYADLTWKMEDWTFGGLFIYASGDDNTTSGDSEAMLSSANGLGKDFNPFQIMTGDYMNILNGDNPLAGDAIHPAILAGGGNAGAIALGAYAKYAMSPKLSLTGELGIFRATDEQTGVSDDYGTEIGIGMGYKLYDNLTYHAHFSYMWTGDFFAMAGTSRETTTENIWLAAHALSMKF